MNLMHPPRLDIFRPMLAIMLAAVYAVPAFESAQVAYADQSQTEAASADTHIHILPFAGTDAIVLESNAASASWIQARTAITLTDRIHATRSAPES
ncbi:MAG: hypothetical protein ACLR3C_05855 [Eggerthella lenta]